MENKLHYNTIKPLLLSGIKTLMAAKAFDVFRLVGGTALSFYRGHRESVDIDLFSDAPYDSIDFGVIDAFYEKHILMLTQMNTKLLDQGNPIMLVIAKTIALSWIYFIQINLSRKLCLLMISD
jgi:hypothetical protein